MYKKEYIEFIRLIKYKQKKANTSILVGYLLRLSVIYQVTNA
jgi:hypothetical protein